MSIFRTIPYAALSATLLAAGGASAQSMGSIDARENDQQYRIYQGIRNGSLTPGEASGLERSEQRIDNYEQRARADGVVSPAERKRLDSMLDREGHSIYRESHDGQRADGRGSGGNDGWGRDQGSNRDRGGGNNGNQNGWNGGERNGSGGNRPNGIEQRDGRNEQRIYNGVQNGSLTPREFGQLQRGQERIDSYEARARSDGTISSSERSRIDSMQNRESQQIRADSQTGRAGNRSDGIEQRDSRNEQRIYNGVRDGSLTRGEFGQLERGQQRVDSYEARARSDGTISSSERSRIDSMQNRESQQIRADSQTGRAGNRSDGIEQRDSRNEQRIYNGVRDGSLTRGEFGQLERGQQRVDSYEARARSDGTISSSERSRIDSMQNRESQQIRADSQTGRAGNRSDGIEQRDSRNEQRIYNGVRDGSLTRGEFGQLERGQQRVDSYEARARSDGTISSSERNRIDSMQNRETRQISADRNSTVPTAPAGGPQPTTGSHNWGSGGWQQGSQAGGTTPTTGSHGGGYGGWQQGPQTGNTAPTTGTQPGTGSHNWGGWHTQQASAAPTATQAPTMTRASAPSTAGRSAGGRH